MERVMQNAIINAYNAGFTSLYYSFIENKKTNK